MVLAVACYGDSVSLTGSLDPNNPNDNVNAPIFGYGKSATSASDRFTYLVVSATNSTVGAARQAVASNTSWASEPRVPILARTNSVSVLDIGASALFVSPSIASASSRA